MTQTKRHALVYDLMLLLVPTIKKREIGNEISWNIIEEKDQEVKNWLIAFNKTI